MIDIVPTYSAADRLWNCNWHTG